MLDVVKTHAYAFKERLGYDVFKRCEDVYFRKHGTFPPINENRHVMPEENKRYYHEIFRQHIQLKKELEEEEVKKNERKKHHEEDKKKEESPNQKHQEIHTPSTRNKRYEIENKTDDSQLDYFVSCDEKELRKKARAMKQQQKQLQQSSLIESNTSSSSSTTTPNTANTSNNDNNDDNKNVQNDSLEIVQQTNSSSDSMIIVSGISMIEYLFLFFNFY